MAHPEPEEKDLPRSFSNFVHDRITDFPRTKIYNLDGTGSAEKIPHVVQGFAALGFGWSLIHAVPYEPPTMKAFGVSVASKTAMLAMMGAIFAGTTSTIGSMTGQDGKLNYFIGGCAAGSVLGARSKKITVGCQGCVFFGGFAVLRKWYDENGWEFK